MKNFLKLFLLINMVSGMLIASGRSQGPEDPYRDIDYSKAFTQTHIYYKHSKLMSELGCMENVKKFIVEPPSNVWGWIKRGAGHIGNAAQNSLVRCRNIFRREPRNENQLSLIEDRIEQPLQITEELVVLENAYQIDEKELKKFHDGCLEQLEIARKEAVLRPAQKAKMLLALMGLATAGSLYATDSSSFGGSFTVFAAFFNAIWFFDDIIRSYYNHYFPPTGEIDLLEKEIATQLCHIPNEIWSSVIIKFMTARQSQFDRKAAQDFINFAKGFTILQSTF